MKSDREEAESEKEAQIRIQRKIANIKLQERLWDQSTAKTAENLRKAGRDEAFISAFKERRKFEKHLITVRAMAAKAKIKELGGRAEGGYEVVRNTVTVAEKGPEWIVPDTPEGMAKYLPMMMQSVWGRSGKKPQSEGAPGAPARSEQTLFEIRDLLKAIEMLLSQGDTYLPENL
jgi:hypothetical protein